MNLLCSTSDRRGGRVAKIINKFRLAFLSQDDAYDPWRGTSKAHQGTSTLTPCLDGPFNQSYPERITLQTSSVLAASVQATGILLSVWALFSPTLDDFYEGPQLTH